MSRLLVLCALLAAAAVSGASPSPDSAASDYYLKIGDIKGEATDGSIEVTGMAWDSRAVVGRFAVEPPAEILARYGGAQFAGGGMAAGIAVNDSGVGNKPPARAGQVQTPREAGSGMATGRRQHAPVTFVKRVDKASPLLMQACADGTHVDVEVWQRNESDVDFLRYRLKNAVITSYSVTRGGDADDRPTESISFNFEKIEFPSATPEPAGATNLNSSRSNY